MTPGRRVAVAFLFVASLTVAACGGAVTDSPSDGRAGSSGVAPSPAATAPTPAPATTAATSPSASAAGPAWDASLLDVLPPDIDGLALTPEPGAAADVAADPSIAAAADRIAFAVVVEPGGELAVAAVVALRPGVFGDAFWRDWRDTYDEGACAQAGGTVGKAEAEIGGRTVHIGSCEGGARTYHAWLPERGVLVSVTAVGEKRRLGERLMEEIRG